MPCKVEFSDGRLFVGDVQVPLVHSVEAHIEAGEVPTLKFETHPSALCLILSDPDIHIQATIDTLQQACAVLLAEYRNDADFRKAVIDSITDVTADVGLSERIADRLFDMETEYADCTTRDT